MKERADFAFVFWMLHEVPDQKRLIGEARSVLAAKGRLLFGEPVGHVSEREYLKSAELFCAVGFKQIETLNIPFSRAVLFEK